jgi:UDP-N-acetylmuramoyl-tripeptide--D-alanyl-D-alanine ligase
VETRSLKFVAEACAAEIRRGTGGTPVAGVCTDSRQAKPGDLFFAIKGERFDGHDFLNEVAAKGVAAVVVEQKKVPAPLPECAVLVVDDARAALGNSPRRTGGNLICR